MFRTNLILAIVAVVLAIPTAWTLYQDRAIFTQYEDIPRLFPGFTRENVRTLVVSRPQRDAEGAVVRDQGGEVVRDTLQLVRAEDDWQIAGQHPLAGVPVRGARVYERVLQHFEAIRKDGDALVRQNATAEELERYGLGADSAVLLQCYDETGPLAELYLGADASRGQVGEDVVRGFFVRSKDEFDVVLYEQSYWVVDVDPAQWYERNPLRFAEEDVVEITLHNQKGHVVFGRENAQAASWTSRQEIPDVGAVRNGEVRALVQSIALLNVQAYLERLPGLGSERQAALQERGLAEPAVWAEVVLADGTRHRIAVGAQVPGKNERYLHVSSVDFVMAVGDWVLTRLEKPPVDVFFDPPASRVGNGQDK